MFRPLIPLWIPPLISGERHVDHQVGSAPRGAVVFVSLYGVSTRHLTDFGLLPALRVTWYGGLLIVIIGTVNAIVTRRFSGRLAAAHVFTLAIVLYGTTPAITDVPRQYPWLYKHIGVVEYIQLHGAVQWSIDIYHRWPGFFAESAFMSWVVGLPDPTSYAAWCEPLSAVVSTL